MGPPASPLPTSVSTQHALGSASEALPGRSLCCVHQTCLEFVWNLSGSFNFGHLSEIFEKAPWQRGERAWLGKCPGICGRALARLLAARSCLCQESWVMFLARGGRWWSLMQSGCLSEDVPATGPPSAVFLRFYSSHCLSRGREMGGVENQIARSPDPFWTVV